jgi:hypothetical protein
VQEVTHDQIATIDLTLVIGPIDDPGTMLGNYFALHEKWMGNLTASLGKKLHVALLNDPHPSPLPASCEKCSVVLYPSQSS